MASILILSVLFIIYVIFFRHGSKEEAKSRILMYAGVILCSTGIIGYYSGKGELFFAPTFLTLIALLFFCVFDISRGIYSLCSKKVWQDIKTSLITYGTAGLFFLGAYLIYSYELKMVLLLSYIVIYILLMIGSFILNFESSRNL